MMRKWHYLKINEKTETVRRLIFVDTETRDVQWDKGYTGKELVFGWACATRRNNKGAWTKPDWKRFTTPEEFWLWAMHFTVKKEKTWVWCHNSSFDYPALHAFSHLPELGWTMKSAIIDAPPTIIKYISGGKTLVLCDTLNIWRMSLKELGDRIGLKKLTMPETWGGTDEDDIYCRRDVEIIYKSVTEWLDFLRANDLGGFCPTIASQSMRAYRHRFMRDKILIDANGVACDISRGAYHGGRVEAGQIGAFQGDFYSLDVNSMYPFVMSYLEVPLRVVGVSRNVEVNWLPKLLEKYAICAHVRLNTNEAAFGILHNGKLCFPVGRFDAYLSSPELKYALKIGALEEIYIAASYEKSLAFREFVLELYRYKEEATNRGDLIEARHFKLLLNSFYGKWGQNGRKWVDVGPCDPRLFRRWIERNAQTGKKTIRRQFGGRTFERLQEAESTHSHPAIAAHITAEARMVLWALIKEVPPSEYFYCDTDGLLVSIRGLQCLKDRLHDSRLGGLKVVRAFHDLTINGAKDYIIDGQQTLKGIRPTAQRLDEKTYRQIRWTSLVGLLGLGSADLPLTIDVTKTLSRTYDKGNVGVDGMVTPFHFPLGEGVRGTPS